MQSNRLVVRSAPAVARGDPSGWRGPSACTLGPGAASGMRLWEHRAGPLRGLAELRLSPEGSVLWATARGLAAGCQAWKVATGPSFKVEERLQFASGPQVWLAALVGEGLEETPQEQESLACRFAGDPAAGLLPASSFAVMLEGGRTHGNPGVVPPVIWAQSRAVWRVSVRERAGRP